VNHKPFQVTPVAVQDLSGIWDDIAFDNRDAADKVPASLHRFRFWLHYSYRIVYDSEAEPLRIIRVLHAGRDIQSLLALGSEL
jgi:plasmid stabilization system protein ParE